MRISLRKKNEEQERKKSNRRNWQPSDTVDDDSCLLTSMWHSHRDRWRCFGAALNAFCVFMYVSMCVRCTYIVMYVYYRYMQAVTVSRHLLYRPHIYCVCVCVVIICKFLALHDFNEIGYNIARANTRTHQNVRTSAHQRWWHDDNNGNNNNKSHKMEKRNDCCYYWEVVVTFSYSYSYSLPNEFKAAAAATTPIIDNAQNGTR